MVLDKSGIGIKDNKMLSCPFCGCLPEILPQCDSGFKRWMITCRGCSCIKYVEVPDFRYTRAARVVWNRRVK